MEGSTVGGAGVRPLTLSRTCPLSRPTDCLISLSLKIRETLCGSSSDYLSVWLGHRHLCTGWEEQGVCSAFYALQNSLADLKCLSSLQSDHHSFLLAASLPLQSSSAGPAPPLFAISFPKPNVISIIDPPSTMTPTIFQAVRAAVGEGAEEEWVGGNRSSGVYAFRIAKVGGWWKAGSKTKYQKSVPLAFA